MRKQSQIDWCDTTWEVTAGCTKISEGCNNCYACRMVATRLKHCADTEGLAEHTETGCDWTGEVRLLWHKLDEPMHWRKPYRIFVNSRSDLFQERVPEEFVNKVLLRISLTPRHTYIVLTKRPERAAEVLSRLALRHTRRDGTGWPLPNLWPGVSVENQQRADERLPALQETPAAARIVSVEPMLGPVDLRPWLPGIDWVICGGESGPHARPIHPDWVRDLRDQCVEAQVPFWFKQWGQWVPGQADELVERNGEMVPRWCFYQNNDWGVGYNHDFGNGVVAAKVGKMAAGHLLDGQEWRQEPVEVPR